MTARVAPALGIGPPDNDEGSGHPRPEPSWSSFPAGQDQDTDVTRIPDSLREWLYEAFVERRDLDAERVRLEATPAALREPHKPHRIQWRGPCEGRLP